MPKEAEDAPSLEAFKARLEVALGSLVWWLATLHIVGGLKLDDHFDPSQSRPFYDSVIHSMGGWVAVGESAGAWRAGSPAEVLWVRRNHSPCYN